MKAQARGNFKSRFREFRDVWLRIGRGIAFINIRAIFTLAYFFIVCPYSLILKLSGTKNNSGWFSIKTPEGVSGAERQY